MGKPRNPYIKFWPSDYLSDLRLRRESLELQGFWLNLICIMQKEGNPFGHLAWDGKPIAVSDLTLLLQMRDEERVDFLLKQIVQANIFSVNPEGLVFCRRLLREAGLSEVRALSGSKGGKKRQSNILLKQSLVAKRGNGNGNGNGNEKSFEKESKLESEIPEWALEIRQTWNDWRQKQGIGADSTANPKGQGLKNLVKLTITESVPIKSLARSAERYLSTISDAQYVCAFANFWGKQRRFETFLADDWQPPAGSAKQQSSSIHDLDLTSSEGRVHD